RRAVLPARTTGAQPARTEIAVLQRLGGFPLVPPGPRTGAPHRTPGHPSNPAPPTAGANRTGAPTTENLEWVHHVKGGGDANWNGRLGADRQLLHAGVLAFAHPDTGAPLRFEAPMPEDMRTFLGRNA